MVAGKAKVGLVLSGGGARGAYEVGVIRYLADIGLEPDMYAGASIGALNGAVLVSAGSLRAGARKLESVWRELVRGQVLEVNRAAIARALVYLVLRRMMGPGSAWTAMKPALMNVLSSTMELRAFLELLDSQPFRRILAKGFDVQEPSEGEGSGGQRRGRRQRCLSATAGRCRRGTRDARGEAPLGLGVSKPWSAAGTRANGCWA